ncbi:MAG: RIP metalloprotease RseP [Deltaproteobacteria bacterium]|nr:RIP metalloprotease RseP [Deltaproteobacteria bacterium]
MSQFLSHPIPAVVILLGLLVFIHELGHYLVGRWCGIAVETFSIGFGPQLLSFKRRGTVYQISAIPLGGFVKFAGSHPSEEVPAGLAGISFLAASLPKRAATIIAGPAANFLLAVVVYSVLGFSGMPHPPALIGEVISGSAAARAGLRYGDLVLRIDQREVKTWRDIEEMVSKAPGKPLTVLVKRESGEDVTLQLTPDAVEATDMMGRKASIGRAGVALGRPAPVVTVLAASSPAGVAGLRTGDKITKVQVGGAARVIKFYPELVAALREAAKLGDKVEVTAVETPLPELAESRASGKSPTAAPDAQERRLFLSLETAHVGGLADRDFMSRLGLRGSELTVAVMEAAPGETAPLRKGDLILTWNGVDITDVYMLREKLLANNAPEVTLTVQRDDDTVQDIRIALKGVEIQRPEGVATLYTLPVAFWGQLIEPEPVIEKYGNPLAALAFGIKQTGDQSYELVQNLASLVSGEIPLKALGGPILIAKVAGDSARRGWQMFLGSMALISINLGLINLFPIPVLDGGQLVLISLEGLRRRPLPTSAIENFQKLGFAMVLALVVLATYNDFSRFWRSMLESVVGIFK